MPGEACAYIAGLIDGEGYVGIKRRMPSRANKMRSPRYSAVVSIGMTDRAAIEFVARFCSSEHLIRTRKNRKPGRWKPLYDLELERETATALLRQILPFLITKKLRAEACLKLSQIVKCSQEHKTKIMATHTFQGGHMAGKLYRVFGLNDGYLKACEDLYQEAKSCRAL